MAIVAVSSINTTLHLTTCDALQSVMKRKYGLNFSSSKSILWEFGDEWFDPFQYKLCNCYIALNMLSIFTFQTALEVLYYNLS